MFANFRAVDFELSFDGAQCHVLGTREVSINPAHVVSIEVTDDRPEIVAAAPATIHFGGSSYQVDVTLREAVRRLSHATAFARVMDSERIEAVWKLREAAT